MNTEALFLFLILLLGLVLCSFLGGNCNKEGLQNNNDVSDSSTKTNVKHKYDHYNHYSGTSTELANGATFYGPNGGSVVVTPGGDGTQTLQIKLSANEKAMTFSQHQKSSKEGYVNYSGNHGSATKYYGPNGYSAIVIHTHGGKEIIQVQTPNGNYTFTQSTNISDQDSTTSTQYYGSTGYAIQPSSYSLSQTDPYHGPYGGSSAGAVTGPQGNTAYYAQGPYGNTMVGTTNNSGNGYGNEYYSTLPQGVPRSQIPPGQEDLYILKSEVVPPVCPACPTSAACPRQEKCPPCPACARCPEPAFECKKVPNYSAIGDDYLPQPIVSSFSQFGM